MRHPTHRFTCESGADVWTDFDPSGEKVIELTIDTPENGITLTLVDVAMLSMLATDMHNGITRRIDRPVKR